MSQYYYTTPISSAENVYGLDTKANKFYRDISVENKLLLQQNYTSSKKMTNNQSQLPFKTFPQLKNNVGDRIISEGTKKGIYCTDQQKNNRFVLDNNFQIDVNFDPRYNTNSSISSKTRISKTF